MGGGATGSDGTGNETEEEEMRQGRLAFTPKVTREIPTLGYIYRPRIDPDQPVPMPNDPHRAPRNALAAWPKKGTK